MNTMSMFANKKNQCKGDVYMGNKVCAGALGEIIGFSVSLILFVALGPFSAIAAIFGLISLASGDDVAVPASI